MYNEIYNPKNGQKVSVQSKEGQEIIRNYLSYLQGGARLQELNKQLRKCQQQMENIQREIRDVQFRQRGGVIQEPDDAANGAETAGAANSAETSGAANGAETADAEREEEEKFDEGDEERHERKEKEEFDDHIDTMKNAMNGVMEEVENLAVGTTDDTNEE